jgi:DNA polymerase-3 subunit delta|tara:strand:- start:1825 stop:2844 length:1020 start_codon:yes stop_codon:yes gene_type:complete
MILKSYEVQRNPKLLIKYNSFLFYGENNGVKKDIKEIIKKELKKKDNNLEVQSFYENEIFDAEENFYDSIYSGSLFSDEKIIIINYGTDKLIKQIENFLEKYPGNVTLIIYADTLDKRSKLRNLFEKNSTTLCIPCYPDTDKDLEFITSNELRKNNIVLSRESINLLIEKSNSDRANLKNEMEKIKSFALNKKSISLEEIKSIINFTGEYKSDSFINECLTGNILQYKKILSEIYSDTVNQIFLLRVLSNKIQKLLNLKIKQKDHDNIDSLINNLKPPIFWKEKPIIKRQLQIWKLNHLKKIIEDINNTELLCKKNPQSSKIIFFNLFNEICKKANNYS